MCEDKPFNLESFLPYRLVQAGELVDQGLYRHYRSNYGMTRPEWQVLAHLGEYGKMSAGQICKQSLIDKTKVSRAVFSRENRAWLVRTSDKDDRRTEWLALTEAGHQVYQALANAAIEYNQRLCQELGDAAAAQLLALLRGLNINGNTP